MALEWSLDTAAGGCDTASCIQAPEWGRGPETLLRVQKWVWKAVSVRPVGDTGGVRLWACRLLLTLVSKLIILLPFFSLGHYNSWVWGHLAHEDTVLRPK